MIKKKISTKIQFYPVSSTGLTNNIYAHSTRRSFHIPQTLFHLFDFQTMHFTHLYQFFACLFFFDFLHFNSQFRFANFQFHFLALQFGQRCRINWAVVCFCRYRILRRWTLVGGCEHCWRCWGNHKTATIFLDQLNAAAVGVALLCWRVGNVRGALRCGAATATRRHSCQMCSLRWFRRKNMARLRYCN